MGEIETNENLNIDIPLDDYTNNHSVTIIKEDSFNSNLEDNCADITEYKKVDEPCVALTIIGENRLTDTEVFVRRGIKYSIKAFFSAIVLTIINMFI